RRLRGRAAARADRLPQLRQPGEARDRRRARRRDRGNLAGRGGARHPRRLRKRVALQRDGRTADPANAGRRLCRPRRGRAKRAVALARGRRRSPRPCPGRGARRGGGARPLPLESGADPLARARRRRPGARGDARGGRPLERDRGEDRAAGRARRRRGRPRLRARRRRAPRHEGLRADRHGRRQRASRPFARRAAAGLDDLMCGVFGIYSSERDVSRLTYFGLFALQHRGQESAGIAVSENGRLTAMREMGLVSQVFDERRLRGLRGEVAIGHTRYSTTGGSQWANAQPLVHHGKARTVALGHNGNLVNAAELRSEWPALGSTTDSEVIAALLAADEAPLEQAAVSTMERLEGAYSVVALAEGTLLAFRDAHGFRPLCLGRI